MSKTVSSKIAVGTMGAVMATGVAFMGSTIAEANPFGATELSGGYMQLAEGSCGEGKCGGDKGNKEGACGADKDKKEGTCGADKGTEGSCGGDKGKEGACGEDKKSDA